MSEKLLRIAKNGIEYYRIAQNSTEQHRIAQNSTELSIKGLY